MVQVPPLHEWVGGMRFGVEMQGFQVSVWGSDDASTFVRTSAFYQACLRGAFVLPAFDLFIDRHGCRICIRLSCHLINRPSIIKLDELLPEFLSSFALVRMSVVETISSKIK